MSRHDEDLRDFFGEVRRVVRHEVPRFQPLRWVRTELESRPTRRHRLLVAGSIAVVLTAVTGLWVASWRMMAPDTSPRKPPPSSIEVRKYVPPPPTLGGTNDTYSPTPTQQELEMLRSVGYVGESDLYRRQLRVATGAPIRRPPPPPPQHRLEASDEESFPSSGPLLAGVGNVTEPVLIEETKVEPRYPELARTARISGSVILAAIITREGTVGEVQLLSSSRPEVGFEQAAIEAVRQWRYEPAEIDGRPVEVYMTVHVEFQADGSTPTPTELKLYAESPTESYAAIEDNPFHVVADEPLSTFSVDVDTASYSNVRRFLNQGRRPPRDAVRVEELINYFDYAHPPPDGDDPFGVVVEVADCPWKPEHRLARITLAARRESRHDYAGSNLVFLLDISGSMDSPHKLPLVKRAMTLLADQLDGRDTVSIVVYAGGSGLVLEPTPGSDRAAIVDALERLDAGGSTAGAEGLRLAYRTARENFIEGGVNRVILATDGDFNVGVTSHAELLEIIETDARRGVYLTALGFGMGNYQDDRLEQLADRGNGNYAYIDSLGEARKVLVDQIGGTLVTVAKDVKIQVEFNPLEVGAYRLIGYENRLLAHRDFNDDTKDAGEIGSGHTVTVLYELVPASEQGVGREVDELRYQQSGRPTPAADSGELFTLKVRFKRPDGDTSSLRTYAVQDAGHGVGVASDDFRFAVAVAAFGMRLRQSAPVRDFAWSDIEALAADAVGADEHGHRVEFLGLVRHAEQLAP